MSKGISYTIDRDEISVKTYIRQTLGISARALLRIKAGGIILNGNKVNVNAILKKGDVLTLIEEEKKKPNYQAVDLPIDIIYEDDNYLIIDKPPFMAVYPAGEHMENSLLNAVAFHRKEMVFRPIYRLDRNTSGIMVIAKNKIASTAQITKEYLAICEGICPSGAIIDSPIGLCHDSRIKRVTGHGQEAMTEYKRIAFSNTHSFVKVVIYTGRTHQIRVHMSSIGFPLAGDDLYGGGIDMINRHALHCGKIHIQSNALNFNKEFEISLAKDIKKSFENLV